VCFGVSRLIESMSTVLTAMFFFLRTRAENRMQLLQVARLVISGVASRLGLRLPLFFFRRARVHNWAKGQGQKEKRTHRDSASQGKRRRHRDT
jgi:hypothetical protein